MEIKKLNPTSSGTRHQLNLKKSLLSKKTRIIKTLLKGLKNQSGRSSKNGRITVRHKGGGVKSLYSKINFTNSSYFAIILSILYDSRRTAFVSLNYDFKTKKFFKNIATYLVGPGSLISNKINNKELSLGNRLQIKDIPTGSLIHSISYNESKIKYVRSAGNFAQLIQKNMIYGVLKLPSGKTMRFPVDSFATLGSISNKQQNLIVIGKAGRNRLMGKRPSVRGIAMNPVDHPHGGRTNGGMPSVTPWGIPTKGKPTVIKKKKLYE